MAAFISTAVKTYLAEYAVHTDLTAIALNAGVELQDSTVFGATYRSRKPGLKTAQMQLTGFLNHANSEKVAFANLGVASVPLTIAPITGAEDEVAYAMLCTVGSLAPNASLGEMAAIEIGGETTGEPGIVRGVMGFNGTATSSASTTGSAVGAVGATQSLYAALHVISVSGTNPTLDVKIQSDTAGWSTASDRITFTQADAATSQWSSVSGAITDTLWRVDYTVGGTNTPTFVFAVFLGIA